MPYLWGRKPGDPHQDLYWRFWSQSAVRSGRWKYLVVLHDTRYLFDLESEEHEHENVIGSHPEIAERLHAKLTTWTSGLVYPRLTRNLQEQRWYEHHLDWKPGDSD
jgi:arylsulfatase A-like enzyme